MSEELRRPKKDGLKIVREKMKEILNKKPSEELIRIINENNKIMDEREIQKEKNDRAAKRDPEQNL